tara:strand:+ start:150 stop:359 length:210 start_codon:yes stop_codon:yes gene_type:complete
MLELILPALDIPLHKIFFQRPISAWSVILEYEMHFGWLANTVTKDFLMLFSAHLPCQHYCRQKLQDYRP